MFPLGSFSALLEVALWGALLRRYVLRGGKWQSVAVGVLLDVCLMAQVFLICDVLRVFRFGFAAALCMGCLTTIACVYAGVDAALRRHLGLGLSLETFILVRSLRYLDRTMVDPYLKRAFITLIAPVVCGLGVAGLELTDPSRSTPGVWASLSATGLFVSAILPARRRSRWAHPLQTQQLAAGKRLQQRLLWLFSQPPPIPEALVSGSEEHAFVDANFPALKQTAAYCGDPAVNVSKRDRGGQPNVVFVFLESMRARDVGVLGGREDVTPNFDRLSRSGLLFSRFFANSCFTARAISTALSGALPCEGFRSALADPKARSLLTLPQLLSNVGYRTAYFDGSHLGIDGQESFLRRTFDEVCSGADIRRANPKTASVTGWGVDDEFIYPEVSRWLESMRKTNQPTFTAIFSISNHYPWRLPKSWAGLESLADVRGNIYRDYLNTTAYADHYMGRFVDTLEDNTWVFILADHGPIDLVEVPRPYLFNSSLHVYNQRIPLLILGPPGAVDAARVDTLCSQVDLPATILDLLALPSTNHSIGTSLLRQAERRVYASNPLGELKGRCLRTKKFTYVFNHESKSEALFRVETDPEELTNRADTEQEALGMLREDCHRACDFFSELYARNRIAPNY